LFIENKIAVGRIVVCTELSSRAQRVTLVSPCSTN
jgi:hypothetical protein